MILKSTISFLKVKENQPIKQMAYHADPTIPGTIEDWLDQFDMFSIYQVLPEILEMWGTNMMTDVASKKNEIPQRGK